MFRLVFVNAVNQDNPLHFIEMSFHWLLAVLMVPFYIVPFSMNKVCDYLYLNKVLMWRSHTTFLAELSIRNNLLGNP
jgi:cytochrome b561